MHQSGRPALESTYRPAISLRLGSHHFIQMGAPDAVGVEMGDLVEPPCSAGSVAGWSWLEVFRSRLGWLEVVGGGRTEAKPHVGQH